MSKRHKKSIRKEPMGFIEILNTPKYRKIVEAIEHGSSDPEIMEWLKNDLYEKTGFRYVD